MTDKNCIACDEDAYEQHLTEIFGTVKLGILEFGAGRIIRELDEIAFRCGMADEECTCSEAD